MNNETETRYPDIEIYLHDTRPEEILAWLKEKFRAVTPSQLERPNARVHRIRVESEQAAITALIIPRIPGRFTGVSFDSPATPWATDLACAREAFARFRREVRCCADSWSPSQDPDEWLRIDSNGETRITWRDR